MDGGLGGVRIRRSGADRRGRQGGHGPAPGRPGKGERGPVEMTMGWLYELRDGKIVRVSMFADREEALAAAGRAPDRD